MVRLGGFGDASPDRIRSGPDGAVGRGQFAAALSRKGAALHTCLAERPLRCSPGATAWMAVLGFDSQTVFRALRNGGWSWGSSPGHDRSVALHFVAYELHAVRDPLPTPQPEPLGDTLAIERGVSRSVLSGPKAMLASPNGGVDEPEPGTGLKHGRPHLNTTAYVRAGTSGCPVRRRSSRIRRRTTACAGATTPVGREMARIDPGGAAASLRWGGQSTAGPRRSPARLPFAGRPRRPSHTIAASGAPGLARRGQAPRTAAGISACSSSSRMARRCARSVGGFGSEVTTTVISRSGIT